MSLTTPSDDRSGPHVRLWVRETAPYGVTERVRTVHERLKHLVERGDVAGVEVNVWGRMVASPVEGPPDDLSAGLRKTLDEFETWADRTGRTLEPAFGVHERASDLAGESDRVVSLPVLCLAVYLDDDLVAVFPCSETDGVRTVEDCLALLEGGDGLPERETPVS